MSGHRNSRCRSCGAAIVCEPSTEIVDRIRWERGRDAAPAIDVVAMLRAFEDLKGYEL